MKLPPELETLKQYGPGPSVVTAGDVHPRLPLGQQAHLAARKGMTSVPDKTPYDAPPHSRGPCRLTCPILHHRHIVQLSYQ
jgi:hypothetical protein